jgi:hypothetical protein
MRFFDFDKVQKDFLAAALKACKTGLFCPWFASPDTENKKTIISDGHFLAIIPDDMLFVKSAGNMREINAESFLRNMKQAYELQPVTDTGLRKTVDKNTVCILKTETDEIWIDEKYLKYFAGMSYTLKGTDCRNPVQVYVLDQCVGMILPIAHK